eukprot:TRINITY_DN13151_c0_g1_i1.p1 TRINITY_DN13151_c0_g1~~TRINITY_DN13151_c0_g1_i1.p1  ORF type:complete len:74 (-),score=12.65 TRINITY_DN13151_c0_g1_i1:89-310(-)
MRSPDRAPSLRISKKRERANVSAANFHELRRVKSHPTSSTTSKGRYTSLSQHDGGSGDSDGDEEKKIILILGP